MFKRAGEMLRGIFRPPQIAQKDLGGCLAQLGREEVEAQLQGITLWEQQGKNPYYCSRHNGASGPGGLTVDKAGRPVCWMCVGMYGLAYDKRIAWNPETGQTKMIEAHPGSPVTGEAIPFGALLRPRSRF